MTLFASAPASRLLDDSKRAKSMLWVMAIMLFLTVLAGAAGLGMASAAHGLDRQLAGRLTIQIIEPEPAKRNDDVARTLSSLRGAPGVERAVEVDRAHLAELLRPWLGEAGLDPGLPMPAMIDVDLASGGDDAVLLVERIARSAVPGAQIDRHARWLGPVRDVIATLGWLALGLVLLMATATGAVVLLAAKSGLDTHRATIDVLHMLGSTDIQIARLFQRRVAIDTLIGGAAGTLIAGVVVVLIDGQLKSLGSEVIGGATLGWVQWLALALLPIAFTLLAMLAARISVLRTLRRVL